MHDAAVIGAGHNGLVAANVLADAGWSVLVVEAEEEPGGAVKSGELIEPGFVHDRFSAFYPLGAASPVFRALGLEIPFRHGPLVLAHPALDGTCPVLERDGGDERWRRLEPGVLRGLITPFPQVRAGLMLAREASALTILRPPSDPLASRLRLGNALHTDIPPRTMLGQAFGMMLTELGRRYGFPCVEGGAGRIVDLLLERARARGVELRLGERVDRLPAARRAVIAACDVWELARLTGRPTHVTPDPSTVKVDWTLDGPIPWTAEPARRSPVVHLGGETDFVLFGQYSMADSTRSPAGKETAWAYSHVLPDAESIEAQVERHAPGFGALVRGRRVEHLPPGRINLGTARARNELFLRPFHGRPETGVPGVYLGSASAHPGGAVHGAPGWIAAQAALRSARSARRWRTPESLMISST
ncbi:MAG TPA: NAD(P)/FAD-dependent oxidoreductase [Gaiellaceae bacterium]|nr:NAD(P)/FAD-dependent oxidoreductase [Gaiellaceae bacterium]